MSGLKRSAPKFTEPETSTSGGARKSMLATGSLSPECIKKRFQIQTAARLQTRAAALHIPIRAPCKIAHAITPFAMCNIQLLVVPFRCRGEVSHFVAAPLQSIAAEGRLNARLLDLGDVTAKFYL